MREEIFVSDPEFDGLPSERLRQVLQSGTKAQRARAVGSLARRAVNDPSIEAELLEHIQTPELRGTRFMGTISLAHIGVACMCIAGVDNIKAKLRPILDAWPDPDRCDLHWFLRSQQIVL